MACFVYGWWAPHRREAVETVRGVLRSARGPVHVRGVHGGVHGAAAGGAAHDAQGDGAGQRRLRHPGRRQAGAGGLARALAAVRRRAAPGAATLSVNISTGMRMSVGSNAVVKQLVDNPHDDELVEDCIEVALSPMERTKLEQISVPWHHPHTPGTTLLDQDLRLSVEQLQRGSTYKTQAYASGHIRPFLLLVSMHPTLRVQLALTMGINLVRDKAFGDPHAEAWVVISRHMWGLRARAATTFRSMNPFMSHLDWYQVVWTTAKVATNVPWTKRQPRHKVTTASLKMMARSTFRSWVSTKDPENEEPRLLEALYVTGMMQVIANEQTEGKLSEALAAKSECGKAEKLVQRLEAAGFPDEQVNRMLAQYLLSESKLEMGLHQEHGHKKRSHDPNACDKGCKTAIPSMQTIKW
eukprot:CAMPEP_0114262274 /NCGR_PEP_ID=MMETSP0058-20121206/21691_1 /TAXON_ID=36894 /ORGANISM="Pyramimonas parkeae, CCMP726" /LENGTH=410 /DNA_ID=CAMNT_0001378081 /DNA_START=46 /DNA_END=1276 /DNA_ORIENTATION=+